MSSCVLMAWLCLAGCTGEEPGAFESSVLQFLRGETEATIEHLRREFAALPEDVRGETRVRVRGDDVEWRFRGYYPAEEISLGMLEYVASTEDKAYESLLVVEQGEAQALTRFGQALTQLRRRLPGVQVEVQLAWAEQDAARIASLWTIFNQQDTAKVKQFLSRLESSETGLRAFNLPADPAVLPKSRVPATILITLRLPQS